MPTKQPAGKWVKNGEKNTLKSCIQRTCTRFCVTAYDNQGLRAGQCGVQSPSVFILL